MTKHPWECQPGESAQAFDAFGYYLRLAPGERSLRQAWQDYWNRPGNALQRSRKSAGRPYGHWTRWMSRWRWQERALAWDAEQAEIERDQHLDRELRERAQAHEEELRQRQLRLEEARGARAVGRRGLLRILQEIESQKLEGMGLAQLIPHLGKFLEAVSEGQRLERLEAGQPTEIAGGAYKEEQAMEVARRALELLERQHVREDD